METVPQFTILKKNQLHAGCYNCTTSLRKHFKKCFILGSVFPVAVAAFFPSSLFGHSYRHDTKSSRERHDPLFPVKATLFKGRATGNFQKLFKITPFPPLHSKTEKKRCSPISILDAVMITRSAFAKVSKNQNVSSEMNDFALNLTIVSMLRSSNIVTAYLSWTFFVATSLTVHSHDDLISISFLVPLTCPAFLRLIR